MNLITKQLHVNYFGVADWLFEFSKFAESLTYRKIVQCFGDLDSSIAPFSLHNLVRIGAMLGKKPGDWYGPASVAYVLR